MAYLVAIRANRFSGQIQLFHPRGCRILSTYITILVDDPLVSVDAVAELVCTVVQVQLVTGVTDPMS